MPKPSKILIVEDDADTAEVLSSYFQAQGYEVLTAAWGSDAIELCQDVVPDLVLQDVRLPDIDGYQVVRELRKGSRTSKVPIIFLTERKGRDDKISGLKLGAVDYVTKPFDIQELRLRVRNVLRRSQHTSLVNPVTGLPGREVAEERLSELPSRDGWTALCVAITGMGPFNEAYGFVAGDDVLRALALIVSNVVDEAGAPDDFVGHLGDAEFLLITRPGRANEIRSKLSARLERAFDYFYPVKDLESGHVAAPMSAEVGMATASLGKYSSPADIVDAVTKERQVIASCHTRS